MIGREILLLMQKELKEVRAAKADYNVLYNREKLLLAMEKEMKALLSLTE